MNGGRLSVASRTSRSARNAGVSMAGQGVTILLGFVTRTVFLRQLGVELLGIQTLLTSVLAIVAVADLGFSGAIMYSLYGPLRERNETQVAAIIRYASRLYRWVALGVAVLGLALLPFLTRLAGPQAEAERLHLYYLVMLAGSVACLPIYHRVLLLEADQRVYWKKLITIAVNVARSGLQIAVLVLWQSFFWFLVIQVVATVLINVIVHFYVGRSYPHLGTPSTLGQSQQRKINASVRAMLVYRISGLALNNTDPILISLLLGTALLGYYSNYMLIVGALVMVLEVTFVSLTPSIGNLVATGDRRATRGVFDELHLLAVLLYGTASVVLLVTTQDGLRLWLGQGYLLSDKVLVAAVLNFYVVGAILPVTIFRGATGMFREARYVMAVTAAMNIALSVVLGSILGLSGVLFATVIARLLTNVWLEPWFLFRRHVEGGSWHYIRTHFFALVAIAAAYFMASLVKVQLDDDGVLGLVLTGFAAAVAALLSFAALLGRSRASRTILFRVRSLVSP